MQQDTEGGTVIRGRFPGTYADFTDAYHDEVNWCTLVNLVGRHRASQLYTSTKGDLDAALDRALGGFGAKAPDATGGPRKAFRQALAGEPMSWNRIAATTGKDRAEALFDLTGGDLGRAGAEASGDAHVVGWHPERHRYRTTHSSKVDTWYGLVDRFGRDYAAELYEATDGDLRIAAAMAGGGRRVLAINGATYAERHGHAKPAPATPFDRALADDKPSWTKLAHTCGEPTAEALYDRYDGDDRYLPLFDGTVEYDDAGGVRAIRPNYVRGDARDDEIERIRALHAEMAKKS